VGFQIVTHSSPKVRSKYFSVLKFTQRGFLVLWLPGVYRVDSCPCRNSHEKSLVTAGCFSAYCGFVFYFEVLSSRPMMSTSVFCPLVSFITRESDSRTYDDVPFCRPPFRGAGRRGPAGVLWWSNRRFFSAFASFCVIRRASGDLNGITSRNPTNAPLKKSG